jgi:hypothetical protein
LSVFFIFFVPTELNILREFPLTTSYPPRRDRIDSKSGWLWRVAVRTGSQVVILLVVATSPSSSSSATVPRTAPSPGRYTEPRQTLSITALSELTHLTYHATCLGQQRGGGFARDTLVIAEAVSRQTFFPSLC